ncbi:MAG TPA: hypothetical protein VL523_05735, partial [Terriglobia bacterium]|nr:hypothetical protein [Terriglobia bacterium]
MLGPRVRVCVACHEAIDPSQIRMTAPAAVPTFAAAHADKAPDVRPKARFSWGIFAALLLGVLILISGIESRFGPQKALYVYWAVQLLSTAWVFFDARQKGIARPLRWAIASLLIW